MNRKGRAAHPTSGERALTEPEVHQLLSHATDFEAEVLLRLAISTGIRREDLVRVTPEGVDIEGARIRFYESKKRRTWEAELGGETLSALRKWMYSRWPRDPRWVFASRYGRRGRKSGHR